MNTTSNRLARLLLIAVLLVSMLSLTGCADWFPGMSIYDMIDSFLGEEADDLFEEEGEGDAEVQIYLTHPAGASPNVFTSGWVFGARAVAVTDFGEINLSDKVKWSGSGSFTPVQGRMSRPVFNGEGSNTIRLEVEFEDAIYSQQFSVNAVSPAGYAAVGDKASCPADSHGTPACPMSTIGPITTGSPNVFVRGRPAARVGDVGVHAACAGSNTFEITGGDGTVLINGRAAAKIGSQTQHCGGVGSIVGP